jgi:hypothetical protein
VQSLGSFQDGGLQHNNPSDIAKWEMMFLWPAKAYPDFALLLGTGASSTRTGLFRQSNDRFFVRLFRNYMQSLDGEYAWKRFYNSLPQKVRHRFHRLNVRFKGAEPCLDDADSMPALKSQVPEAICGMENDIRAVLDAMLATIFYFELDGPPAFLDGLFQATGYIYCRLDLPEQGRRYLYSELLDTSSWFLIQGSPVACVGSVPKSAPPFKRRIVFSVEALTDVVAISIRGITSAPKLISGFPTTLQGLIDDLKLDSPFGTVDHFAPEKPLPPLPSKRPRDGSGTSSRKRHRTLI